MRGLAYIPWTLCSLAVVVRATPFSSQTPFNTVPLLLEGKVISRELYDTISALLENNTVPGYSLAIVRPGSVDEFEFGTWGNRTEDGDQVTPDTLYCLASVSKAFTATGVGILMDDFAHGRNFTPLPDGVKEFTWTTKVKDLLPDLWELLDPWASSKANVKDILSHTSGLPRHDLSYGPADSTTDIITRMRHLRPAYELREKYHYNNQMYMLASHLVARYSGLPYQTFMSDRIFTPLKMAGTTYWPSNASSSGHFSQSWMSTGRRIPHVFNDKLVELNSGPGGVISSAKDMAKWAKFLLDVANGKEGAEVTEIPVGAPKEAMTPHVLVPSSPKKGFGVTAYGMGWHVSTYQGRKMLSHGGSVPGISTAITLFPDDKFGVVQLANADGKATVNDEILWEVVHAALGIPPALVSTPAEHVSPENTSTRLTVLPNGTNRETLSVEALAGTYTNDGYGHFTLCAPTSISHYCDAVLSKFRAVNPTATDKDALFGVWPRIWGNYVHLVRAPHSEDGNRFIMDVTDLYPEGYGQDKTPFESSLLSLENPDGPAAQFVVDGGKVVGFGVFGTIGEETKRQRTGSTVEERAEVWFRRV